MSLRGVSCPTLDDGHVRHGGGHCPGDARSKGAFVSFLRETTWTAHSTERSLHDLDLCLKKRPLRGTKLERNRLAFLVRLSRRPMAPSFLKESPSRRQRRRRIWRTTPSKSSSVLWCKAAEVSICLQFIITARLRPSGGGETRRKENS